MSRLKHFAHALVSGYVQLGANIVFTLASVPLALDYLSKPEFGLWALTTNLAIYLGLIDFGMSSAVSRVLVDHKDQRDGGDYGGLIKTAFLVCLVQGAIALALGAGLALVLGPLLNVPPDLAADFRWLTLGQGFVLAGTFAGRVFNLVLAANQRYDVANYVQSGIFLVTLGVMWAGFAAGAGVYSFLWAQLAGLILTVVLTAAACFRLRLLPRRGCWGRASRNRFRELFAFGSDIFLFVVGAQLISSSQVILVTRVLGLEAGATWSICTRAYQVIIQVIYRIFDFSCAALAEMIVRGEKERLQQRFRALVVLSCSLSVVAAAGFAIGNQPFVQWWTRGKVSWPMINDALLAAWLVVLVLVHAHTGLVGQTKDLRKLSHFSLGEGLCFILGALLLLPVGGVSAMVAMSIVASLAFTFPYGIFRTREYFGLSAETVAAGWIMPSVRTTLLLAPIALLTWWVTRDWPVTGRLAGVGGVGLVGAVLLLRVGLDPEFQQELIRRLPASLRKVAQRVTGRATLG